MATIPSIPFAVGGYVSSSVSIRQYSNAGGLYDGVDYEFQVTIEIQAISNSTPQYQSDGTGVEVGQWFLQSTGLAYLIVDIIDNSSPSSIVVVLRDVDLYNVYSDISQAGLNAPLVGNTTQGIIFAVSEDGKAIITYATFQALGGLWLSDAIGRFSYRNFIETYYNFDINNKTIDYSSYSLGQIVYIGQLGGTGPYCFIPIDPANSEHVEKAFGTVSSVISPNWEIFTCVPLGELSQISNLLYQEI